MNDEYMKQHLAFLDDCIAQVREMHESNLRLLKETEPMVQSLREERGLSRPESRVRTDDGFPVPLPDPPEEEEDE